MDKLLRKGFTLIELIVVMIILVAVMALVMPQGAKMLSNFQNSINRDKEKQKLSTERSKSFLSSQDKEIEVLSVKYHISSKGVVTKYENSNDNH